MKFLKIEIVVTLVFGILAGCSTVEAPPNQAEANPKNVVEVAEIDPKQWKDATFIPNGLKPDFPTNVNDYFENTLNHWNAEIAEKYSRMGYPPEYNYYIEVMGITSVVDEYIRVQGVDLEKDVYNLRQLAAVVEMEQWKRAEHIDPNSNKAVKQWKPASERFFQAVEYMKQLLTDLNYITNGTGEPYGVTHQLDGDKVDELNSFLEIENDIIEDYLKHY